MKDVEINDKINEKIKNEKNNNAGKNKNNKSVKTKMKNVVCEGCGKEFESKNSLFRHLRSFAGVANTEGDSVNNSTTSTSSCLSPEDYGNFMRYVVNRDENLDKIAVLYGYIPSDYQLQRGLIIDNADDVNQQQHDHDHEGKDKLSYGIHGGDHAAQLLLEAIQHVNLTGSAHVLETHDINNSEDSHAENSTVNSISQKRTKINRSYGWAARGTDIVAQDEGTGALTEILCTRAPPIHVPDDETQLTDEDKITAADQAMQLWIDTVNRVLQSKIISCLDSNHNQHPRPHHATQQQKHKYSPGRVCVFGRITVPKKFNAEIDATHRRVDYIMPADFLFPITDSNEPYHNTTDTCISQTNSKPNHEPILNQNRDQFFRSLGAFTPHRREAPSAKFDRSALTFLYKMKKLMQRFCTQIVELNEKDNEAVLAKEFHTKKRAKQRKGSAVFVQRDQQQQQQQHQQQQQQQQKGGEGVAQHHDSHSDADDHNATVIQKKITQRSTKTSNTTIDAKEDMGSADYTKSGVKSASSTKTRVLKRRRFHNFTPKVMAHEFLAYRRLDRFYHRATVRLDDTDNCTQNNDCKLSIVRAKGPHDDGRNDDDDTRPFVVLSLTGDLFLNGQVRAVIGLFVAIIRGYVHEDILDCIFDEGYTSLVPAPLLPATGLYAGETTYMTWEGKIKAVLSARCSARYDKGFNSERVRKDVSKFETEIQEGISRAWNIAGITVNDTPSGIIGTKPEYNRNRTESQWVTHYLEPWAKNASIQLQDYRRWKVAQHLAAQSNNKLTISDTLLPPMESIKHDVPSIFQKVLSCLREANSSGLWPSTTPKRQLVMVSTNQAGGTTETNGHPDTAPTALSVARIKARTNTLTRTSAYVYREGEGGASGSFSVGAMPGTNCEQPKGNSLFPELMKAAFELEIELCPDREPSSTIAINRNAHFRPHLDNGAGSGQSTSLIVGLGTYVGGELVVEGDTNDIRYKYLQFNGWTQRHWTLPFRGERFSLVWFTPKGCEGVRGIDLCT